jgi:hypothetical protein
MNLVPKIKTLFSLLIVMGKRSYATTIAPENGGEPLPPIRWDGDPADIYTA